MRISTNSLCQNVKQLDDRALACIAEYFQALSEPLRLKILNELRGGPRNVNDLTTRLACSQANVSKHLGVLARRGLVARDTQGTAAYYRISDPVVYSLCDLVCEQIADRLQDQVETFKALSAAAGPGKSPAVRRAGGSRK